MSEEKIINLLQKIAEDEQEFYNTDNIIQRTAIQGLLDLYQKEKEKNKENTAMIDLMAKVIVNLDDQLVINHYRNKEDVIKTFKELLEERNK